MSASLVVNDLGRIGYAEALIIQRRAQQDVINGRAAGVPMQLLLLEHDPPVLTVPRRAHTAAHVLADAEKLRALGVEQHETDRGGDVTYHGPGQVVAYAIFDLERLHLGIHEHLRLLEQAVIEVCARFGIAAGRDASATGVWIDSTGPGTGRKICAMGVRVSRWVSMHGLALNVSPDLTHFDLIVPCGLAGRKVTSMAAELGPRCPTVAEVKAVLAAQLSEAVEARLPAAAEARLRATDACPAPGHSPPSPS